MDKAYRKYHEKNGERKMGCYKDELSLSDDELDVTSTTHRSIGLKGVELVTQKEYDRRILPFSMPKVHNLQFIKTEIKSEDQKEYISFKLGSRRKKNKNRIKKQLNKREGTADCLDLEIKDRIRPSRQEKRLQRIKRKCCGKDVIPVKLLQKEDKGQVLSQRQKRKLRELHNADSLEGWHKKYQVYFHDFFLYALRLYQKEKGIYPILQNKSVTREKKLKGQPKISQDVIQTKSYAPKPPVKKQPVVTKIEPQKDKPVASEEFIYFDNRNAKQIFSVTILPDCGDACVSKLPPWVLSKKPEKNTEQNSFFLTEGQEVFVPHPPTKEESASAAVAKEFQSITSRNTNEYHKLQQSRFNFISKLHKESTNTTGTETRSVPVSKELPGNKDTSSNASVEKDDWILCDYKSKWAVKRKERYQRSQRKQKAYRSKQKMKARMRNRFNRNWRNIQKCKAEDVKEDISKKAKKKKRKKKKRRSRPLTLTELYAANPWFNKYSCLTENDTESEQPSSQETKAEDRNTDKKTAKERESKKQDKKLIENIKLTKVENSIETEESVNSKDNNISSESTVERKEKPNRLTRQDKRALRLKNAEQKKISKKEEKEKMHEQILNRFNMNSWDPTYRPFIPCPPPESKVSVTSDPEPPKENAWFNKKQANTAITSDKGDILHESTTEVIPEKTTQNKQTAKDTDAKTEVANRRNESKIISALCKVKELEPVTVKIKSSSLRISSLKKRFETSYQEGMSEPRKILIDLTQHSRNKSSDTTCQLIIAVFKENSTTSLHGEENLKYSLATLNIKGNSVDQDNLQELISKFQQHLIYPISKIVNLIQENINMKRKGPHIQNQVLQPLNNSGSSEIASNSFDWLYQKFGWKLQTFNTSDAYNLMSNQSAPLETPRCGVSQGENQCFKCSRSTDKQNSTSLLSCKHLICNSCWKQHVQQQMTEIQVITCPYPGCTELIDSTSLLYLVTLSAYRWHLNKLKLIISNQLQVKWCPSNQCDRALKLNMSAFCVPVSCSCGSVWCYDCKQIPHWPATCKQAQVYLSILHKYGAVLNKASDKCITSGTTSASVNICYHCLLLNTDLVRDLGYHRNLKPDQVVHYVEIKKLLFMLVCYKKAVDHNNYNKNMKLQHVQSKAAAAVKQLIKSRSQAGSRIKKTEVAQLQHRTATTGISTDTATQHLFFVKLFTFICQAHHLLEYSLVLMVSTGCQQLPLAEDMSHLETILQDLCKIVDANLVSRTNLSLLQQLYDSGIKALNLVTDRAYQLLQQLSI